MADDDEDIPGYDFEAVPAGSGDDPTPDMEAAGQAAIDAMGLGEAAEPEPVSISDLTDGAVTTMRSRDLEVDEENAVNEVGVELSVVLGETDMPINQLLKMGRGAVIELNSMVDDDVQIFGNNRMIARGQVIVVGENIAVSITDTVLITDT
jgi:flagellar motor switch protein FliN/FliY